MRILIVLVSFFLSSHALARKSLKLGLGNPAAKNCIKLGGALESFSTPAGQDAYCVIDEWLLWREMNARGLVKPHNSNRRGTVDMPNPAAVNCKNVGGQFRLEKTPAGDRGLCVVEQWTLIRSINVTQEQKQPTRRISK